MTSAAAVRTRPGGDRRTTPRPDRGRRRRDAASRRSGAASRRVHHRAARGEAIGRDRAPQPGTPPHAPRRHARGGPPQEHPDDRADRRWQDRDREAGGPADRVAVHQGGGDQVHRGRLRGPRRRVHPSRSPGADHHGVARGPRRRGGTPRASPRGCAPRRGTARGDRTPTGIVIPDERCGQPGADDS